MYISGGLNPIYRGIIYIYIYIDVYISHTSSPKNENPPGYTIRQTGAHDGRMV